MEQSDSGVRAEMYDIPLGFHFKVEFGTGPNNGDLKIDKNSHEVRFQEVNGISSELGIETYDEGGENGFSHRLPGRAKYNNLTLKRGMLSDSKLRSWFQDALENFKFDPIKVSVMLLNEKNEILNIWEFYSVWPVKWTVSDFKAQENALVIETVELAYQYFKQTK